MAGSKPAFFIALVVCACSVPAHANGLGENYSWQFQTAADRANKAFIEDMRQKQRNGFYNPPTTTITTNIDKQFNCSLSATATGNLGSNGLANSGPGASGNLATAKGNESQTDVYERIIGDSAVAVSTDGQPAAGRFRYWNGFGWVSGSATDYSNGLAADVVEDQSNLGPVTAKASGNITSAMGDSHNYQALNSTQNNSGTQNAQVDTSTACTFASAD